jgi:FKBP-type peptidyl-prolyl cis-trans isomerase
MAGLRDAAAGKAVLSDKEKDEILNKFEKQMNDRDAKESKDRAEKNKKDGATFLAENKKKEGVKVTPSGLQYKVLTEGSGPSPKATDSVKIQYRGTLIDGTEFDSSLKRKVTWNIVPVTGVILGWTEAFQMMKVGSKWQLFVPADLGYRDRGAGREVPPNATLIYEVELLSIENSSAKK